MKFSFGTLRVFFALACGLAVFLPAPLRAQPTNLVAVVRHAPNLNGNGIIGGSVQQLLGENVSLNGGFTVTGDLFVPGSPAVVINGNPTFGGMVPGSGGVSPGGYQVKLNGNIALRYLRTRSNPVAFPVVTPPPAPTGTRSVTLTSSGQSIGDPSTLRNLTLNGSTGPVAVPPGTYGDFTVKSGGSLVLGVAGATTPAIYNLQNLDVKDQSSIVLAGPVLLTVASGFSIGGGVVVGSASSALQLQIASGGLTIHGNSTIYGTVTAPAGTVVITGTSCLYGLVQSDRLTVNGGSCINAAGGGPANQAPVANAQDQTVAEDNSLAVTLAGTDPEGAALNYEVLTQPTLGTLSGTAPNLVYHPDTNKNGSDSFTFKVNDGVQDSAPATVSFTITPVNDAPVAQPQSFSTAEDTAGFLTLVGTDVEGSPLTFTIVDWPQHGALEGTPPDLTYVPTNDYCGPDSFTFKVNDGALDSLPALVSISVVPVNDRPVADHQTVSTDEDTARDILLTGEDPEFDPLNYEVLTQPAHGTLSGTPPFLTYLPTNNYSGPDSFTFRVSDATTNSEPATVSLTVRPVNDAPNAPDAAFETSEDSATNLVLSATDVDSSALNYSVVTPPAHGTWSLSGPNLVYSPAADYFGPDSFTFQVSDGALTSAVASVSLSITPVNDAPVADAKNISVAEDAFGTITLTGSDVDGDALSFERVSDPLHGTISGTPPDLIYTPHTNFFGADSFDYIARNGATSSTPVTVSITVAPVNDAPTVADAGATTDEDTAVNLTLTGADVENDTLTFTNLTLPQHGTLTGTSPNFTYTPAPDFHGTDTFTFTAFDGTNTSAPATFTITINPVNDAPGATPGLAFTIEDASVNLTLTGSDVDGDPLTFAVATSPAHGTLRGTPPNLAYTPAPNYFGPDSFTFTASDGLLASAPALISIEVSPVNDAPVVTTPGLVFAREDEPFLFEQTNLISVADVDAGNAALTMSLAVTNGTIGVTTTNGLTLAATSVNALTLLGPVPALNAALATLFYVPATNFYGRDDLSLLVQDGGSTGVGGPGSAAENVVIAVADANEAPFVSAGQNRLVFLPDSVLLAGVVMDDGLPAGAAVTAYWEKVMGPGEVAFAGPVTNNTTVSFSAPGNYILRLWAHDTQLTNYSDVTFVVKSEGMNAAPTVNAGGDKVIGLTNALALAAFAEDDGLPRNSSLALLWTKVSGPGGVAFASATSLATTATFDLIGTYVLRLTASDSVLTASHEISVTVYPFNQPPVVEAGPDQTLTIPDPAVLAGGAYGNWSLSEALFTSGFRSDQWNPAISQPGLSLVHNQVGAATPLVTRDGLAFSGTNLFVAGVFYNAGGLRVWTLGRWDGTTWSGVRDGNLPTPPGSTDIAGFVPNDSTGRVIQQAARGQELFVLGSRLRDFNLDGGLDSMARFTGSNWMVWGPQRLQRGGARAVAAVSNAVYFGAYMDVQATNGTYTDRGDSNVLPGLPVSHGIAKWDGTNWSLLGDGISGAVASIAVASNRYVYAGGTFMNNVADGVANNIARWDGTNWMRLGAGLSCSGVGCTVEVSALAIGPDGHLYAAGSFTLAGGLPANRIARWDGTNWTPLDVGLNGTAYALAFSGSDLYTGGAFTTAGGFAANKIAKWNGRFWSALGSGSGVSNGVISFNGSVGSGTVHSLAAAPNGIYVGGEFKAGYASATNIALWEFATPPGHGVTLDGRVTDDGLPPNATLSVTWSKAGGPGNVTFENIHTAGTTATFDQLGTYVLRLTADDSELTALDEVTVVVQGNQPPLVSAGPDQVIDLNATTLLQGSVADDGYPPGADVPYVWSVVTGPGTVTFGNPLSTNSSVSFSVNGTYLLRLTANDSHFTSFDDVVIIVLANNNFAPNAVARALPEVLPVGQLTTLTAHDLRDDGRPFGVTNVLWSQVSGPAPLWFFNPTSAVAQALATVPGAYRVRVEVNDGELSYANEYSFTATAGTPPAPDGNQPPMVNGGPDFAATAFANTPLHGTITDDGQPQGTVFASWFRVSGPANVYFANAAAADTAVKFYVPGSYVLRLVGSDGRLAGADEVSITVAAPTNQPPLVTTGPDLEVVRPAPALLEAAFFDDALPGVGGKTFAWSVASGPGAVTFSPASGNISNNFITSSANFSSTGTYVLRVTVSDALLTDSDTLIVTVRPGTNSPPIVFAGADQIAALPNAATLHTEAIDDGLEDGLLDVFWTQVSGPGVAYFSTLNGEYRATFSAPGEYVLRLTADDGSLSSTDDVVMTAYESPDAPVVAIVTPGDGQAVTFPSNIIGTVESPVLSSYSLQYRLAPPPDSLSAGGEGQGEVAGFNWLTLATGHTAVTAAPLGTLDPTLLLNGTYELQLTATDLVGRTSTTNIFVVVDRNMKVGNFTLSFNDLTIPVAGIPIQVIRTYDSRDKREGDFGVGWTLDLKNIRLQKNRNLGKAWDQSSSGGLFPSYCIDTIKPRVVTISFPDNKVYKFQASPGPACQFGVPLIYPRMSYTPLANTRGTLTPVRFDGAGGRLVDDQLVWGGEVPGRADFISWELLLDPPPGPADNILYNPDLFEFRTLEGYTYLISETNGLRSLTDPNGNTLVVNANGLTWTNAANSTTLAVQFQRDAQGRITNIVDALGHAMTYRYDTNGNLATFTDREGNTNGFTYDGRHGLLGIADARGIEAVRNEYDDSGRLVRHIDANGRQIDYAHDINNRLEIITNRLGFVTISEYDERGNVAKVTDANGVVTSSAYDDNDNLLLTIDPLGRTNSFTYDARDNRTSVTDALGHTTRVTYNDLRRVTSATDARGNTITNVYDQKGNLTSMRDPLGNVTTFVYSEQGQPMAMTNTLGFVTRFEYDGQGRVQKEIDSAGHETTFQRDTNENLLTQSTTCTTSTGLETLSVLFRYDSQSRLTNSILPDGSSVRTIYNAIGKAAATIDQIGRVMSFDYDEFGRVARSVAPDGSSESRAYDAEGRRVASTNKLGQVTQFEYDAVGRLFRTIYSDGTSATNYFDLAGQVIASTDARGRSSFYGYDAAGRTVAMTNALGQVSRSFYDEAGNLVQTLDALGRVNTFQYDALNRRTNTVFADGTTQRTAYDALGRRMAETDQAGITSFFDYDALGRLTSVTNAHGDVTRYEYNELGQQLRQIDANDHATSFEYDTLGRRVKRTLPGAQIETYAYSVNGLLTNRTDFNGDRTAFVYDVMNRLVQKTPDPRRFEPSVTIGYNELGLRTNMVDASGVTTYRYDQRNRLIEKATPQGTLFYAYDANGSVTNIQSSNANGVALRYGYDELNRLNEVVDPHTGRTSYTYDEVGNLRGYTLPNGVNHFYEYSALNRLTNLNVSAGLSGIANYAYALGAAGNRLSATETIVRDSLNPQPTTINRFYGYDRLYRLTNETIGGTSYASPATLDYSYDKVGNRLSLASTLANIQSALSSFDLNDRLTTDTYDANGNTTVGRIVPNTPQAVDRYDFENRLVNRNSSQVQIVYDGDGNRVRKTVNGVTTLYLVDTVNPTGYAQVLEELTSSNAQPAVVTRVYAYGHALLSQDQMLGSSWGVSYYGTDGHGSVRFLTDHLGFVTDTYDYDAFGNLTARTGSTPNHYLFTGEQFDSDLGLYYLRARYANPSTGRFWSMDSFEGFGSDPTSLHKYTYCGNNPVNCIDPSGRSFLTQTSFAVAARTIAGFAMQRLTAYYTTVAIVQRAAFGAAVGLYFNVQAKILLEPSVDELIALSNTLNRLPFQSAQTLSAKVMELATKAAELQEEIAKMGPLRPLLAQVPFFGVVMAVIHGIDLNIFVNKVQSLVVQMGKHVGVGITIQLDYWSVGSRFLTGLLDPAGDIRTTREILEAILDGDLSRAGRLKTQLANRLSVYGKVTTVEVAVEW